LDDLPAGRNKKESRQLRPSRQPRLNRSNLIGNAESVNRRGANSFAMCVGVSWRQAGQRCCAYGSARRSAMAPHFGRGSDTVVAGDILRSCMVYCSPPHWIFFEAKLAIHTKK